FLLGRQMFAGKARKRIGLVVADVRDWRGGVDRLQAAERELLPAAIAFLPVAGCGPALVLHGRPAVGEPERRIGVAAGLDEFEPLAVGDEAARDAHGSDQNAMRGTFVVEAIALAVMADGMDALGQIDIARC